MRGEDLAEKIRETNSVERMVEEYKKVYRQILAESDAT